jgi:hypothetical protein
MPPPPLQGDLSQLHQASVYVDGCVPAAAPLLPASLAAKARQQYLKQSQHVTVSRLQRDVKHALAALAAEPDSPVGSGDWLNPGW